MRAWRLFWIFAFLIACTSLSKEDRTELNFLNSAIYDLNHPTSENANVTQLECENYQTKALRYGKIPVLGITEKVSQYVSGCRARE